MKTRQWLNGGGGAVAFCILAIASASSAWAQQAEAGNDTSAMFQNLDKNQDGHLSRSEIPTNMSLLRSRLSTYDSNQDGALDPREFATAQAALNSGGQAGGSDATPAPRHPPGG